MLRARKTLPVQYDEAKRVKDDIGAVIYMECSALTGNRLKAVFDEAIK